MDVGVPPALIKAQITHLLWNSFILEGLLTFVFAVPAWWIIPDFPEDDRILRGIDQKRWAHHLQRSQGITNAPIPFSSRQLRKTFTDWKNYVYALLYVECTAQMLNTTNTLFSVISYFGIGQPFYSLSLFTPSIVAALGYTNANANLLSVPPFAFAFVTTLAVGRWSDQRMQRGIIIIMCLIVSIVGYIIQLCDVSPGAKYFGVFLCVGAICPAAATSITWIGNK